MQWFDLKVFGAKLERSREASGPYFLKLSFEKAAPSDAIINSALEGWVASEERPGGEFRNYREFSRTSTIVAALEPFFTREQLIQVKTEASKLRQGEELLGFTNPIGADHSLSLYPEQDAVARNLEKLIAPNRDRILARVAAAQEVIGSTPAFVAFEGRAVEVWHQLAGHFGYHDATTTMMAAILRAKSAGEHFHAFHDAILSASESGRGLPSLDYDLSSDKASLVATEEHQRLYDAFGDRDHGWNEDYFHRRFIRQVEANFAVWDGKALGLPQLDPESYGTNFKADPSMPASWRSRMFMRASMAIEQSAQMIGIHPRELFGDRINFHLGKRVGMGRALGYFRQFAPSVAGEIVAMRTIKFSPNVAGVMVHEMGHGVEFSHRREGSASLKREDIEAILLDDTGIRIFANWQVDQDEGLDDRMRAYLKDPSEIIARSFEAALADHLRAKEDHDFLAAGGMVALNGGYDHAPHRDLTARFVKGLHEVVSLTRKFRLEAEEEKRAGTSLSM